MRNPPTSPKLFTLRASKSAANLRSKFGQRLVERLEKKECKADWFAIEEKQAQTPPTTSSTSTTNSPPREHKADKQMAFLTESGAIVNLSSTKKKRRGTRSPSPLSSSTASSRWQPLSASAVTEDNTCKSAKERVATSKSYRHQITWKPYFTEIG